MKKIFVEKIQDGMVLAKDVCGSSGSALLNKGTTLTESMGRRLKNWGVSFICVEGEEEQRENKPASSVAPEEIRAQLENTFADVMEQPIMKTLCNAVFAVKTHQPDK